MARHHIFGSAAIAFGVLTTFSGGSVLFGPDEIRTMAGNIVGPVLWFNFLSGPVYIAAGIGLLTQRAWARALSALITIAIGIMLLFLIVKILTGTAWEPRTLAAMALRLGFWAGITAVTAGHQRKAGA